MHMKIIEIEYLNQEEYANQAITIPGDKYIAFEKEPGGLNFIADDCEKFIPWHMIAFVTITWTEEKEPSFSIVPE